MESQCLVSQALQGMATILETLESTETELEIISVTPVDDELLETETVALKVCVAVPFLDTELSGTTLRPETVSLQDDGRLAIEFEATVDGPVVTEATEPDPVGQPRDGEKSRPRSNAELTVADEDLESSREAVSKHETHPAETTGEKESSDEQQGSNDGNVTPEEDPPAYRDPERLRDAYETYETFAEMTRALEVDVTAQTVRRYMIEYDIHTPASRTGSQSAETLLEADPDSLPASPSDQGHDRSDSPEASDHATP